MIKKPAILWILLVLQIISMLSFTYNVYTLFRESVFIPMVFANYALGIALIWMTVSYIKHLSKSEEDNTDLFS